MYVQVSCPVFRCTKTSISKCTGYRRSCDRYYCREHTKGTLCERCENLRRESLKAGYKQMMETIARRSYSASLTAGIISLFSVSLVLLVAAIVCGYLQRSSPGILPVFVLTLAGAVIGFACTLIWYVAKAREYVRAESVELDLTHPGFYDYYQQWQAKLDEITTNVT